MSTRSCIRLFACVFALVAGTASAVYFFCFAPAEYEIVLSAPLSAEVTFKPTGERPVACRYGGGGVARPVVCKMRRKPGPGACDVAFGVSQRYEIRSVSIRKLGFLKVALPLSCIPSVFGLSERAKWEINGKCPSLIATQPDGALMSPDPAKFASCAVKTPYAGPLVVALFALGLFILILLTGRRGKCGCWIALRDALTVALAVVTFFCMILPLQTYLAHEDLFVFSFGRLMAEILVAFACVFPVMALLSFVLRRTIGKLPLALMLGCVLAAIVESGPLAIGLPELNGDFSGYGRMSRMIWDAAVLIALLLVPALLSCLFGIRSWLLAVGLVVFASLSLLDVKRPLPNSEDTELAVPSLQTQADVVESVEYSGATNVIVLIADSISREVVCDVFRTHPDLAQKFPGFVNYIDNLGMQWNTSVALPGLMTGEYLTDALSLNKYGMSLWGERSFFLPYVNGNFPVYVNVNVGRESYTNRLRLQSGDDESPLAVLAPMNGFMGLSVSELSVFRLLPYALKRLFVVGLVRRHEKSGSDDVYDDRVLYPRLSGKPVRTDIPMTLQVHHTYGCHPPMLFNENGESAVIANPTYAQYLAQCVYVFKLIGGLMDYYRATGVYDRSTIIIAGDHGVDISRPGEGDSKIPQRARPALMVKARDDRMPYSENKAPTSHSRIAQVVRALANTPLTRSQIEKSLVMEPRMCRQAFAGSIMDWIVSADGKVVQQSRPDREPDRSELRPLQVGVLYDFNFSHRAKYPDFILENGSRNSFIGVHAVRDPMRICLKAPNPGCTYRVEFDVTVWGAVKEWRTACGTIVDVHAIRSGGFGCLYALERVSPDADGFLHFTFARQSGESDTVGLCTIRLVELDDGR